jgi:DNA transformation protein
MMSADTVRAGPRSDDRRPHPKGKLRSLKVSEVFRSFVLDQLQELGGVASRTMFDGVGLYSGGVFFGILAHDKLFLKVGDANCADYEHAGMKPFKPYRDRRSTMRYYEVPLAILESPLDLVAWAQKAIAVAKSESRR